MPATPVHINQKRLDEVVRLAVEGMNARRGIFHDGPEVFLPQHNLPKGFEYVRKRREPKRKLLTRRFLVTEAFNERRAQTKTIIKRCLSAWENPATNWIFDPYKVARANIHSIEEVFMGPLNFGANRISRDLELVEPPQYVLFQTDANHKQSHSLLVQMGLVSTKPKRTPPVHTKSKPQEYQELMTAVARRYDGDPGNMISGLTVEQARANLMEFDGIGTGIANLYILYLMERDLVTLADPHNAMLKIDIHKSRIPGNTRGWYLRESESIVRRDHLVKALEPAFLKSCSTTGYLAEDVDRALWIIGSQVCTERDYVACERLCPLYDVCETNVPTNEEKGIFVLRDEHGKEYDLRKNQSHKNQTRLLERHE